MHSSRSRGSKNRLVERYRAKGRTVRPPAHDFLSQAFLATGKHFAIGAALLALILGLLMVARALSLFDSGAESAADQPNSAPETQPPAEPPITTL